MSDINVQLPKGSIRERLFIIIFGHMTPAGWTFDIILILCIIASVVVVMLDSVHSAQVVYGNILITLEWVFTIIFTIEYALRIFCAPRPLRYMFSFFGLVDLLAIIPTYLGLILPESRYLAVIRFLRVLRVFRVLKITQYVGESNLLMQALWASRRKVMVFLFTVLTIATIFGSLMYVLEGEEHGYTSIPKSIYWAIVTLTTVGYGDISPETALGQFLSSVIMIMGYSIIAVPTGIVSAEIAQATKIARHERRCLSCDKIHHEEEAQFCPHCGAAQATNNEDSD